MAAKVGQGFISSRWRSAREPQLAVQLRFHRFVSCLCEFVLVVYPDASLSSALCLFCDKLAHSLLGGLRLRYELSEGMVSIEFRLGLPEVY